MCCNGCKKTLFLRIRPSSCDEVAQHSNLNLGNLLLDKEMKAGLEECGAQRTRVGTAHTCFARPVPHPCVDAIVFGVFETSEML